MKLTTLLPDDPGRYGRELALLEQVHAALGAASKLEEFYTIVASLLVDENTFGFSRAFFLRYDPRTRTFTGRLALGARSADEHAEFRRLEAEENLLLQQQIEAARRESSEPHAVQPLYDLRYHSLWIRLLQGLDEGTGMNAAFQSVTLRRDELPPGHLVERAAAGPAVADCPQGACRFDGLEEFVTLPAVAGRLMTRRGLHGVFICDQAFEPARPDEEALYHLQWLLNHASIALENVELVSQLTETTQRLQEVDRLKTNFLSVVSHELRTPLTSIVGFIHLLAEERVGPITPSQADLLRRVSQHASHLHNMVNDLLEIAEVEAGGMINVALQPVDPLEALLNVIPKVETRRSGRRIEIAPEMQENPPRVICDPKALERIYFHLLDNAAKFTPADGQVLVSFRQQKGRLDIEISDTGIGISEENLQRIFDHFYQVDSRLERAYGGMGIGLTVVKLLLNATEGQIRLESQPGQGSRFTLSWPVAGGG